MLASRLIMAGEWSTYGDLGAAATGGRSAARQAARLASTHPDFCNAHRVLARGGVIRWGRNDEASGAERRARLEAEGVAFRGRRADPSQRLGWVALRGRIIEFEALARSLASSRQ